MAMGIVVIVVGIVVVGGVAIGVALLFMGLLSGSSKAMPDPRPIEEPGDRKEILEKLARKEITKEEAEAALNAPIDSDQDLPPPQAQTNVGCIIGILAAVIIGILLVIGAFLSLFLVKDARHSQMTPMPAQIGIPPDIMEEAKTFEADGISNVASEVNVAPVEKEEESKPNDSSKPNTVEDN